MPRMNEIPAVAATAPERYASADSSVADKLDAFSGRIRKGGQAGAGTMLTGPLTKPSMRLRPRRARPPSSSGPRARKSSAASPLADLRYETGSPGARASPVDCGRSSPELMPDGGEVAVLPAGTVPRSNGTTQPAADSRRAPGGMHSRAIRLESRLLKLSVVRFVRGYRIATCSRVCTQIALEGPVTAHAFARNPLLAHLFRPRYFQN